jgi:hypothetical protein
LLFYPRKVITEANIDMMKKIITNPKRKEIPMMTKKVLMMTGVLLFMGGFLFAQEFQYIGAAKCKMCHNSEKSGFQYKIWSAGPHANALKSLASQKSLDYAKANGIADPTTDPKCLDCHSTYHMISKEENLTLQADEGVSCESCHGPGSKYKSMTIMKSQEKSLENGLILPVKEVCETCHNERNPFHKPFNYDEAVKKIAHPTPE